jgi:hypothetical protein
MPFLVVMVFWLAVIFASFGLFAPRNATAIANLFVCALSVSGAIFLIFGIAPGPAREGWRVRRGVHRVRRLWVAFPCLPGSFLRADTHIARFSTRIQSLSGLLGSRALRLAKQDIGRAYRIDLLRRLRSAPNE